MGDSRTVRLFVAVDPGERVRDALARVPGPDPAGPHRVRRVDRRNLHLTLKFLGDVEEARIGDVTVALERASEQVEPFRLEVAGLGVFPLRGSPRIVWAGCSGGPALERLQAAVEEQLERIGFDRDRRPFHPHVTLGRVKPGRPPRPDRGSQSPLPGDADDPVRWRFGDRLIRSIALVRSTLTPEGAVHREVARLPLGRGGAQRVDLDRRPS